MLFFGAPGTGKSMLSHAIAQNLKKPILQVQVSQIHSMWSGECEKNIVSLFKTAKEKDAVICLDEAESLIFDRQQAKRSFEVAEVNVFLESIERFEGIIIMTTNLEGRIDPALERRVSLKINFDPPSADIRERIWQKHIPESIKLANDVNWQHLAEKYSFSGGYIKNAVLSAFRHMIARNDDTLRMDDLINGGESEINGMLRKTTKGFIGFAMT